MKKLVSVLLVSVLVLSLGGISQAVSLQSGPTIIKTLNYEVGSSYSGGVAGTFYFRNAAASYNTDEYGLLTYTGAANQALFADVDTFVPAPIGADEDSWGLLRITQILHGDVTAVDSTFGDGSNANPIGNDITAGAPYWSEGTNNEFLVGMFWGSQDQVVECVTPNVQYRIWSSNGQLDVFVVDGFPGNPAIAGNLDPTDRTDPDEFANWFDRNNDELFVGGTIDYFRFTGDSVNPTNFNGQSEVLANFTRGSQYPNVDGNWWTAPNGVAADMWQSWNIGDPFIFSNGWTGSEDTGRFNVVPEPVTMLGMFLGIGGLTSYIRKRRSL